MGKQSKSARKAENKVINEIYQESVKLKDQLELNATQWGMLFGAGALTATIPCGLFFTAVYSIPRDVLSKSMVYFAIGVLLTGLVMAMNYNRMSSKERSRLIMLRASNGGADSGKQVQAAFVESASFAIMLSNAWYFLTYFFFVFYALPSYQLNDASTFFTGSVGSSLVIFLMTTLIGDNVDARKFLSSFL